MRRRSELDLPLGVVTSIDLLQEVERNITLVPGNHLGSVGGASNTPLLWLEKQLTAIKSLWTTLSQHLYERELETTARYPLPGGQDSQEITKRRLPPIGGAEHCCGRE